MGNKPPQAEIKKFYRMDRNIRFDDHMPLITNEVVTHSMEVNHIKLYYQPYTDQRVEELSRQYQRITNKNMERRILHVTLEVDLPLKIFVKDRQTQRLLQKFLNLAQHFYELSKYEVQEYGKELYAFQDVIKLYVREQTPLHLKEYNQETPQPPKQNAKMYKIQEETPQPPKDEQPISKQQRSMKNNKMKEEQFTPYEARLYLQNFEAIICSKLTYMIEKGTSLFEIIGFVSMSMKCQFQLDNLSISDEFNKIIPHQVYNNKISELEYHSKEFTITYLPNNCYFKADSRFLERFNDSNKQMTIDQVVALMKEGAAVQVVAYNPESHNIQTAEIKRIQEVQLVKQIYLLQAFSGQRDVQIYCSKDVLILNKEKKWTQVKYIKEGDQIYGISDTQQLVLYKVIKIQIQTNDQKCFSISSPKFNNIVLNGLIVHNKNSIRIKVHQVAQTTSIKEIQVYRDTKLKDLFGNRRCQIIGNSLKNEANIGDYVFSSQNIIYVYELQGKNKDLMISQRNQKNFDYYSLPQPQRQFLKNKWEINYLGISKNQIILLDKEFQNYVKTRNVNHMIVEKRGSFENFYYFQRIEPKYRKYEQECYQRYKKHVEITGQTHGLDKKAITGIKLYTQNDVYSQLNKFLYSKYNNSETKDEEYLEWLPLTGWIYKSLSSLPNYDGLVYRGMKSLNLKQYLGLVEGAINQTVTLLSFTSASKDQLRAESFSNDFGCMITIRSRCGKQIQAFSEFPHEKEVLFFPFTQFAVIDYDLEARPQKATLEELPLPHLTSDKIVYWVDDNPSDNRNISEKIFKPKGIQVIEVLNTKVMAVIIKKYFWMFKVMGKKVVVISDMSRFQNDAWNNEAGVDLFNLIYNVYGLSNKAIIYTMDIDSAQRKFDEKGVNKSNWIISNNSQEIVAAVLQEFQRI